MGKDYQQPISQGQFYMLLSLAESGDKVLKLNADPGDIKLNESALEEMVQMSEKLLFACQHSLIKWNGVYMCLFDIRSEHFLSDKIYSTYSSFCLTETNINDSPAKHIDKILDD